MNESHATTNVGAHRRLKRGLQRFARDLRDILHASLAITTNFAWCEQRGEQLSLLDTDVVCSTLRLHAALRATGKPFWRGDPVPPGESEPEPQSEYGSELEQRLNTLIGAQTMRHVVADLVSATPRQRYALPPGTQYELLRQVTPVRRALAEQARTLLTGFDSALNSADPISALKENGILARLPKTLTPALDTFITAYDDHALLRQLFEHAESVDTLVQSAPPRGIEQAYNAALHLLSSIDATRARNHALDAANVAFVVWMLGAPEPKGVVPILISNTRALRLAGDSLQEAIWLAVDRAQRSGVPHRSKATSDIPPPRAPSELSIVNNHFYLMIWQRLARIGWSPSGAIQHASALAASTNNLLQALGRLRVVVEKRDSLASALKIFGLELEEYASEWQGILGEMRHDAREDAVTLRNTLLSSNLEQLLEAEYTDVSKRDVRDRIQAVYHELLEIERENAEVEALIVNTAHSISDPAQHFAFSGHDLQKSLPFLSDWRLAEVPASPWAGSHRVVAHCRFLPWEGALFVADLRPSKIPDAPPLLEVTWVHAADSAQLATKSTEASATLLGHPRGENVDVSLCFSRFMKRQEVPEGKLHEWLSDALATSPSPDEFQVAWGSRAIAFDVEPIGTERRAQFHLPLPEWTNDLCAWLASFMVRTKLLPINEAYVRWALDEVVTSFVHLSVEQTAG